MFFNVALFSTLFLVPAVLAVPLGIGASVARLQSRDVGTESDLAGAFFGAGNVRSIFHGLFCDRHRSHPHLVLYDRELSTGSPQRSLSPPHRVRPGLLPSPGFPSPVKLVLFYMSVSFSPLPMVNPSTLVRR